MSKTIKKMQNIAAKTMGNICPESYKHLEIIYVTHPQIRSTIPLNHIVLTLIINKVPETRCSNISLTKRFSFLKKDCIIINLSIAENNLG
jgi:hypothetical protein